MRDRVPSTGKANRIKITLDDGSSISGKLSYDDGSIVDGSAWSKANVLPDTLCDQLGIDRSASEVKDAFAAIKNSLNGRVSAGSYVGTGTLNYTTTNTSGDTQFNVGGGVVDVLIITAMDGSEYAQLIYSRGCSGAAFNIRSSSGGVSISIDQAGNVRIWNPFFTGNTSAARNTKYQLNAAGMTYYYIAIKEV